MSPSLALFVCIVGIGGLFFLDRDTSARTSKVLWLPVIWVWLNGSRPLSVWLGMSLPDTSPGQLAATSPLDQLLAGFLMLLGIVVIVRRRREVMVVLRASWPIALYFSFCLLSLLWSDFPGWGFKRWIRALGEFVMVMIVVTDAQPVAALRRFLSRVGFILLPASFFLIKYYPSLGQGYDQWGFQINTGVTTNKNALGVVAFVVALGTVWQVLKLLLDRKQPNCARRLLAQCTLLSCGIEVLFMAHSATSGASFVLGAGLMVATALPLIRHRPVAVHALVLAILLGGVLSVLLGGYGEVVKSMGRKADFTGRTEIWNVLSRMAPNPIVGAGFETFWIGPRVATLDLLFRGINEAHNGYIEVYLNLGCLGIGLLALVLGQSYRRAVGAFRRDPAFGGLLVAYIVTAMTYSITEAGFRMLGPAWFFLLLSVVSCEMGKRRSGKAPRSHAKNPPTQPWWPATAIPSTSTRPLDEQVKPLPFS
jgi:exopolysaccharide production protein ExoQ